MIFYVRYRIDTEEQYTTDSHEIAVYTWEALAKHCKDLENAGVTVLELKRTDIGD